MTAEIADALEQIYAIEAALSVDLPLATDIKKVWPFFPPNRAAISETPCFLNAYSPQNIRFESALLRTAYAIHARLLVYDGDLDRAAAIAVSFVEPIIDAFAANLKLGMSHWTVLGLRFNEEQPRVFEPESGVVGKTFLGLDFFIDLEHKRGITFAAGSPP